MEQWAYLKGSDFEYFDHDDTFLAEGNKYFISLPGYGEADPYRERSR